jgi:hypothetical protein
MKSDKRRDEPSAEVATPEEFPLELVAATALHFLEQKPHGLDQNPDAGSYGRAVRTAISFLKLCAEAIEVDQGSDTLRAKIDKEFENLGWEADDIIPYEKGIKFITGQKRLDRAQEYYEAYRKKAWPSNKPLTASELTAALKRDEQEGFKVPFLAYQRAVFKNLRASGRLGLKRRKKILN